MFQIPNRNDNYLLKDITNEMKYDEESYSKRYKFWIYSWCVYESLKYINKDSKIMDAGPGGLGHTLWYLSNILNYKVYASDLKKKSKNLNNINNLIYKKESLFETSYDDNFFDVIFCISVIEHMNPKNLINFFDEMHRILKPNGKLILSTVEIEWNYNKEVLKKSNNHMIPMNYMKTLNDFELIKSGDYTEHPNLDDKNIYFNKRVKKIWTEYCCVLNNKE